MSQESLERLVLADPKAANELLRLALAVDELIEGGGATHWRIVFPPEELAACPYLIFAKVAHDGILAFKDQSRAQS